MQILKKDLYDKLIMDFSYHDAKILKIITDNNNVTILLKDGWLDEQVNEIKFIDCKIEYEFDLENRIIYQLDDLANFGKWHMSFLIWANNGLLEKVEVEAKNIISKKYETANNQLNKDENLLISNYSLVREEDLNKEMFKKS